MPGCGFWFWLVEPPVKQRGRRGKSKKPGARIKARCEPGRIEVKFCHEHGAEIESAIRKLKPREIRKVGHLVDELREELWDQEIDAAAKAGKLDKLMEEAGQDFLAGRCQPFP